MAAGRASVDERRVKVPPVQSRPTAPDSGSLGHTRHDTPQAEPHTHQQDPTLPKPEHQRFVLTDPIALRYLEEDSSTTVLERRQELRGYECYIVEQWTTSRTHPTFVITTYTGDPSHVVVVGVLSVPTDETAWSPRLRVYLKALNQYHARRHDTPLGVLMVTNLSAFPSSLTVIPVPDGDLKEHRYTFFINENLKRLGCSGRVGLTLVPPSGATVAKFHQLYRTSDKNDIYQSVIELVKLCQSALMLFDKLEIDYADGLLCDVTERAINDWWIEIGGEQYGVEPHDGILGPTTVAALLGLLMGARSRLHATGAPVAKDAFDVDAMKRGISHFQKQQRVHRTRRLDRTTLQRLHKATAKAASSEGWMVPRAVKSTVAELSGKGGEMVMDVVGRRDRAGIAEIETTDIERFVQLVYGERCKWLWYGKPLKRAKPSNEPRPVESGLVFKPDDHGGFTWTSRKSTTDDTVLPKKHQFDNLLSPAADDTDTSVDDDQKASLFRRATGLGKFKDAVTLKTHHQHKAIKEDSPSSPNEDHFAHRKRPSLARSLTSPLSSPASPTSITHRKHLDTAMTGQQEQSSAYLIQNRPASYIEPQYLDKDQATPADVRSIETHEHQLHHAEQDDSDRASDMTNETADLPSIAGSVYNGVDLNELLPTGPETDHEVPLLLRRTLSHSHITAARVQIRAPDHIPRHLSFSLAEDSVLTWQSLDQQDDYAATEGHDELAEQLAQENFLASETKSLRIAIDELASDTADWTQQQLRTLRSLLEQADVDQQTLEEMHRPHLDAFESLQQDSQSLLKQERERLLEGGKELETLAAKLEYEIGGLKGRIEDVEAGVDEFDKGVRRIEDRVSELEREGQPRQGWAMRCVVS